jgi:predicted AlkP superfamily phosphohydrolase/phosphomutase
MLAELTGRRADLALELLGRGEWECAIVNFTEPHFAGHAFFHHLDSAEPPRLRTRLGARDGLLAAYAAADAALGRLMEAAGPEADVIAFSTIGLRTNETAKDLLGSVLVALGYEVPAAAQPPRRGRRAVSLAMRLTPRFLRHRLRALLPSGAIEGLADSSWADAIDWGRSRAVSEAEPGSAWIRINLAGREPQGIVATADRDALIAEITADLERLTSADTGERAVAEVLLVPAIADGSLSAQMPDLLVRWRPGPRIHAVRHPRAGLISDGGGVYARTEHSGRGFLIAAGPSIAAAAPPSGTPAPREVDLAPTALHMFGSPVPAAMDGEVLEWLLRERRPVERAELDITAQPTF